MNETRIHFNQCLEYGQKNEIKVAYAMCGYDDNYFKANVSDIKKEHQKLGDFHYTDTSSNHFRIEVKTWTNLDFKLEADDGYGKSWASNPYQIIATYFPALGKVYFFNYTDYKKFLLDYGTFKIYSHGSCLTIDHDVVLSNLNPLEITVKDLPDTKVYQLAELINYKIGEN